jgi:hypothetical protein
VSSKLSKLEKNTFVEDLTLNIFARAFDFAVGLLENKSKSSALEMFGRTKQEKDELKDAVMKTSIVFESIFVAVFWSLTLHNVIFEMIVLWGFLSSTSNAVGFHALSELLTMSYQVASY